MNIVNCTPHVVGHNRLSAFGVIGTYASVTMNVQLAESQSPFGFWGDWNQLLTARRMSLF